MHAMKKAITEKLVIRQAKVSDFDRVKGLLLKADLTTDDFFTRERFADTLQDFGKYNLVAERNGKVVGYIYGYDDSGKSGKPKFYGWMGRLIVDPEYRNQGIGGQLTEAALKEFKNAGYEIIFAGVKRDNAVSKKLLEGLGFKDEEYLLLINE